MAAAAVVEESVGEVVVKNGLGYSYQSPLLIWDFIKLLCISLCMSFVGYLIWHVYFRLLYRMGYSIDGIICASAMATLHRGTGYRIWDCLVNTTPVM